MNKEELKTTLIKLNVCIDNEYLNKYVELMVSHTYSERKRRLTQRHHIIPQYYYKFNDMTVDDTDDNCVNLTRGEHAYAHYYLSLCSTNNKYTNANVYALKYIIGKNIDLGTFDLSLLDTEEFQKRYENARQYTYVRSHAIDVNKKVQQTLKGRPSPNKGNKKSLPSNKKRYVNPNVKNIKLSMLASKRIGEKNSFFGKKHSDISKKKIALKNGYSVAMLDYDTHEVIKTFISASDAAKYLTELGLASGVYANHRILDVCKSKDLTRVAYGYHWKFTDK